MKRFILIGLSILLSFMLLSVNAWAVDDADIQLLQTDVSSAKIKADKNTADIENMKGGLPAEAAARKAADEALLILINSIPAGEQGPQGLPGVDGAPGVDGVDGAPGACDCPITQEQLDDIYDRIEYLESMPQDRFTDMHDGTIRDNNTRLIWLKDASCSELPGTDSNGREDWDIANEAAAALANGTCGLADGSWVGDWRLPTKIEWEEFLSTHYENPALVNTVGDDQWSEGDVFTGVQTTSSYWTSTDYGLDYPEYAYSVSMWFGTTTPVFRNNHLYVWPVRSGQ